MEIQKFEAYTYKGPTLKKLTRDKVIEAIRDHFIDARFADYTVDGDMFNFKDEILYLFASKDVNGKSVDNTVVKLDLSDLGIEIGDLKWNDETEEYVDFVPEINLDTDITKQIKSYKKDINKYNV